MYLDRPHAPDHPIAMAHRGGAKHPDLVGIENTMQAFEHALRLGFDYLETDTHSSADGTLFAFHDDTLDRVTGQSGSIGELSTSQLQEIQIDGQHPIPQLDDLLGAFPESRVNIDLKDDRAVEPLVKLIARHNADDRVCVGSFSHKRLIRFRRATSGRIATSASPQEVAAFLTLPSRILKRAQVSRRFQALQVPVKQGAIPVVNRSLIRRAHRLGVHVHVWTVDDRDEMQHLLALGVDGLITDRTDVLKNVLSHKGLWKGNP
ncbi:MAG TPA: glycerophosphodiester phosphodiesterase [Marmoricola sp.]|nr:glycerophosphodiester phosphodiesterase [Nocardioidaceae bacterium]HRV67827.1 glycerophosphodiester phosphodiesterase [Marmoricola sp.]